MRLLVFCVLADTDALSRVDRSLLPQQTLMELLFDGFESQIMFRNEYGDYNDISEIKGLFVENEVVKSVDLFLKDLEGTLDLAWMPHTVMHIDLARNGLHGTLKTERLPEEVVAARLDRNKLSGSLSITQLPPKLKFFSVSENSLDGSLDFSQLPNNLVVLDVSINKFFGVLDFRKANRSIEGGAIASLFYGFWRDSSPPESLDGKLVVNFFRNSFTGDILVKELTDIKHKRPFKLLECKYVADEKGDKKAINEYPRLKE